MFVGFCMWKWCEGFDNRWILEDYSYRKIWSEEPPGENVGENQQKSGTDFTRAAKMERQQKRMRRAKENGKEDKNTKIKGEDKKWKNKEVM